MWILARNILAVTVVTVFSSISQAESWPMKQKDCLHTGRADVTIAPERLNSSFFDVFLWQTPTPDSPNDGRVGGGSMPFYDGVGPDGADLVIAGYHWPKGVAGLERHTGELLWSGNPDGGEVIGELTPAFSADGSTIYVINDWTNCGASLMAFHSDDSPINFWGNEADETPSHFERGSLVLNPATNMLFASQYYGKTYGALDNGSSISECWQACGDTGTLYSEPSVWTDSENYQTVITTGRYSMIYATDDYENELWQVSMPDGTDATPTIDPDNGNIYLPCGWSNIYIVGLDINGNDLWHYTALSVYDYENGAFEPQRASGSGCLSHDGSTYYFQTIAQDGSGELYAINTIDGSLKWRYETQSKGWDYHYSCPIVTQNNVIVVGNNENGTYFALQDNGQNDVILLDTLAVSDNGEGTFARASATIDSNGIMYLPLRTTWSTANGNGDIPDYTAQNLFCAFDLGEDAATWLYPPSGQRAYAGNETIQLQWEQVTDLAGIFDHYAIYRSESPFSNIVNMTPIAELYDMSQVSYNDTDLVNGNSYYYAITAVALDGSEYRNITAIGPRIPRNETDLQIVSIARTPFNPRYMPNYTDYQITESDSGFGPYWTSAATGLGNGQDENTKHYPNIGDNMTYTATIRNRGTNAIDQYIDTFWIIDGSPMLIPDHITLTPGESTTRSFPKNWDDQSHEIEFFVDIADARTENNSLTIDTMAVGFLTYIDRTFIENFRDVWSANHPGSSTDDIIDWLNFNAARLNELFELADCPKRVRYDVLEVLDDTAPDPTDPATINFAIFPFRYRETDGDPRLSGYYHNDDDIDYGLLHEMAHQLGMIDVYQLDLSGENNLVNGDGYSAHPDLMHGCDPLINEFHALAMTNWYRKVHGMYGQFIYDIPAQIQLQLTGVYGQPLDNAQVTIYQMCDLVGFGKIIPDQAKYQGNADTNGIFTLPNFQVDSNMFPPSPTGEALHDNPFGYAHVVGTNGLLLFKVEYEDVVDYCWLDITETNVAYWKGNTQNAIFARQLSLGGEVLGTMPLDLAENNVADWESYTQGANGYLTLDTSNTVAGGSSIKFTTNGGFDTYIRYPGSYQSHWNLSNATRLNIWFYAENDTPYGFQNGSPWIRLYDNNGYYMEYQWYLEGWADNFLNKANYKWQLAQIDLWGDYTNNGWNHSMHGEPDMSNITALEIHADTWDYGFKLWVDGINFDWEDFRHADFATDGIINIADLEILAQNWLAENVSYPACMGTDINADGNVDLLDFALLATNWLNE